MSLGKSFHIEIENHCHEDFSKMNPTERGRFCSSCQKNVIDFSVMSDDEIINYFKNYSSQQTCGRFTIEQMSKEYFLENPKSNFRFTWMRKMVAALFLLPLSFTKVVAQHKTKQNINTVFKLNPIDEKNIEINGRIYFDNTDYSLKNIKVNIDSFSTMTNKKGKFKIYLPVTYLNKNVKLTFENEQLQINDYFLTVKSLNKIVLKADYSNIERTRLFCNYGVGYLKPVFKHKTYFGKDLQDVINNMLYDARLKY